MLEVYVEGLRFRSRDWCCTAHAASHLAGSGSGGQELCMARRRARGGTGCSPLSSFCFVWLGVRAGDQIVAAGEKVLLGRPLEECLDALTFPERPHPLPRNTRLPSIKTLFFRGCITDLYGARAYIHLQESGRLQDIFESVPSYYALPGDREDHFNEEQTLSLHEKMLGKLRLDKAFGHSGSIDDFIKRENQKTGT